LEQLDWFQPFGDSFPFDKKLSFLQIEILGFKRKKALQVGPEFNHFMFAGNRQVSGRE
jgi:hypothetical protein